MKIIFAFLIFCLVLFIYLHVNYHLKTSDDLEIYEVDDGSKDKLEEIFEMRQPTIFDFDNEKIVQSTNKLYVQNNYNAFEIKIRNTSENSDNELYMPLPLHAATKLFDEDKTASYFTESNNDFLQETGLIKSFQYNDEFLRPSMVSNCNYDIMMGSQNTLTPFRYELNFRNFLLVTSGSVQIKLTPPKSSKYLYPIRDYENFEFHSPVNPWQVQPQYRADFDKIKCLEITLNVGKCMFIPPYWWYSIKFNKDSSISCFNYRTYMNNIAISPHIAMYALQMQNVKRDTTKKHDVKILNSSNHTSDEKEGEKEEEEEEEEEEREEGKITSDM